MKAADLLPYEQVHVLDVDNGARLVTYCIEGRPAADVCINGAAARLVHEGDKVIVLSYHTRRALGGAGPEAPAGLLRREESDRPYQ